MTSGVLLVSDCIYEWGHINLIPVFNKRQQHQSIIKPYLEISNVITGSVTGPALVQQKPVSSLSHMPASAYTSQQAVPSY